LHYLNSTYIAKIYTQTNFIIRQFLYGGAGGNRTHSKLLVKSTL
jgi:hypothetical protein